MMSRDDRVSIQLDAALIARARVELGLGGETDTVVVERAMNAYLLGRIVTGTQAQTGLPDDQAERLAYDELHAARRERDVA